MGTSSTLGCMYIKRDNAGGVTDLCSESLLSPRGSLILLVLEAPTRKPQSIPTAARDTSEYERAVELR